MFSFELLGLLQHLGDAGAVFALVAAEVLHRIHALALHHCHAQLAAGHGVLDALTEAVHEVEAEADLQLVDAAVLHDRIPEEVAELKRRLVLRRQAQALRVAGEAVHDVGDGQAARAARDTIVAGGAHPHGGGGEHFVALTGADHHEEFLGRMVPVRAERAGAGADAALHAHLDPVALLDVGLDLLEEVAAIFFDHRLIHVAHGGAPRT